MYIDLTGIEDEINQVLLEALVYCIVALIVVTILIHAIEKWWGAAKK